MNDSPDATFAAILGHAGGREFVLAQFDIHPSACRAVLNLGASKWMADAYRADLHDMDNILFAARLGVDLFYTLAATGTL